MARTRGAADVRGYDHYIVIILAENVDVMLCKERSTEKIVNGNIKEALYLSSVEIHGKYAVGARSGNEVCNELCGDGIAAFCLTVLAGVAEIRDNSGYSACGCSAHRVYHDEHLHEVIVNGLAGRLNDENIGAANGLVDGYGALAVSEVRACAVAEVLEKLVADLICELGIGVAGEYLDLFAVGNHFKSSSLYLFGVSPIVFIYSIIPNAPSFEKRLNEQFCNRTDPFSV